MSDADLVQWLALTREDPVDARRRIIDSHHHLWHKGDSLVGGGDYLVEDLLCDTRSGHNVTQTVAVECGASYRQDGPHQLRSVGETEFVAGQAATSEGSGTQIAAIVAFADLTLGDAVEEVLQAHEIAGRGRYEVYATGRRPTPRFSCARTPTLLGCWPKTVFGEAWLGWATGDVLSTQWCSTRSYQSWLRWPGRQRVRPLS